MKIFNVIGNRDGITIRVGTPIQDVKDKDLPSPSISRPKKLQNLSKRALSPEPKTLIIEKSSPAINQPLKPCPKPHKIPFSSPKSKPKDYLKLLREQKTSSVTSSPSTVSLA
jgi:hypothetical protein